MEIFHIYEFGNIDTVVSNNHRKTIVFTKISKERYFISNKNIQFINYLGITEQQFNKTLF